MWKAIGKWQVQPKKFINWFYGTLLFINIGIQHYWHLYFIRLLQLTAYLWVTSEPESNSLLECMWYVFRKHKLIKKDELLAPNCWDLSDIFHKWGWLSITWKFDKYLFKVHNLKPMRHKNRSQTNCTLLLTCLKQSSYYNTTSFETNMTRDSDFCWFFTSNWNVPSSQSIFKQSIGQ